MGHLRRFRGGEREQRGGLTGGELSLVSGRWLEREHDGNSPCTRRVSNSGRTTSPWSSRRRLIHGLRRARRFWPQSTPASDGVGSTGARGARWRGWLGRMGIGVRERGRGSTTELLS